MNANLTLEMLPKVKILPSFNPREILYKWYIYNRYDILCIKNRPQKTYKYTTLCTWSEPSPTFFQTFLHLWSFNIPNPTASEKCFERTSCLLSSYSIFGSRHFDFEIWTLTFPPFGPTLLHLVAHGRPARGYTNSKNNDGALFVLSYHASDTAALHSSSILVYSCIGFCMHLISKMFCF